MVEIRMQILQQREEKLLQQKSLIQANINKIKTPNTTSSSVNPQPNHQSNSEPTVVDGFSSPITGEIIEDVESLFSLSNLHTIEPLSITQPLSYKQKGELLFQQGELEEEI